MMSYLSTLAQRSLSTDVTILPTPEKSPNDKKEYRAIQLSNGLKALLVSDLHHLKPGEKPVEQIDIDSESDNDDDDEEKSEGHYSADSSSEEDSDANYSDDDNSPEEPEEYLPAVSMSVGTGSYADPSDLQGLMHFLEHMVFMGSKKYPNEEFFSSFVSKHGGDDNGVTDFEKTTFHFDIQEQHVRRGLDIFSQFFISPLLKVDAIRRERKAVNSEFLLAIPNDENRIDQLFSVMANESHPLSQFPWGNLKSLDNGKSRSELRTMLDDYRKKFYVANNMTLALQAKESLDTMQKWVIDIFSQVPSGNDFKLPQERWGDPFIMEKWHKHYGVIPVDETNSLRLYWSLPPQQNKYTSLPFEYISTLLGDEGKGSILAYLKKRMWALDIFAGEEEDYDTSTNVIFTLHIELTDEGIDNMENILLVVFQYLELMRSEQPRVPILKEIQNLRKVDFQYHEEPSPADNVVNLSKAMHLYKPEHYVTGGSLMYEFSAENIERILSLMTVENCCIVSLSKKYKRLGLCHLEEKWFGTQYFVEDIPNSWQCKFVDPPINKELGLPPPNRYVCNDFTIITTKFAPPTHPYKEFCDDRGELWFKPDYHFNLPRTYCSFRLLNKNIRQSPKQGALMDLCKKVFSFVCTEELYPMNMAHYQYYVNCSDDGLRFDLEGFSQKFYEVFDHIISLWNGIGKVVTKDVFEHTKMDLLKSYHNSMLKPETLVSDLRLSLLQNSYWQSCEKLDALKELTMEEFVEFSLNWSKESYLKMLIQGNATRGEAYEIFKAVHKRIETGIVPTDYSIRTRKIPTGSNVLKVPSLNQADSNSVIINYYQDKPGTLFDELLNEFLVLTMRDQVFDQLRTKEQLGYDVSCCHRTTANVLALSITVFTQAEDHTVEEVDNKIDQFLRNFTKYLKNLPASEFKEFIETLKSIKNQVDTSLSQEIERNWYEMVSGNYLFDRRKQHLDLIPNITRQHVLDRLEKITSSNKANTFRKLSVQIEGSKTPDMNVTPTLKDTLNCTVNELVRCITPAQKSKSKTYVEDYFRYKEKLEINPPAFIRE